MHTKSSGTLSDALDRAVSLFGASVTPKLQGEGAEEDQLRGPFEELLKAIGRAMNRELVPHGEVPFAGRAAIPDYAITIDDMSIGHVELKAPGKGVEPQKWSPRSHDGKQWNWLRLLPNVLYTDGDSWALYRGGNRVGGVARLRGSVRTSGARLAPADGELLRILTTFLHWIPQAPESLGQLVKNIAGLCRVLRDEVRETLREERAGNSDTHFADLVEDWRRLLFPNLGDEEFSDAYAQTVTFALLLARVENIHFEGRSIDEIARLLGKSHSLMGRALTVLTEDWILGRLAVTVKTLTRIISTVDWDRLDDGSSDAYLGLYERFLAVYDSDLRKETGSYYTPITVVTFMVRFVDDVLRNKLRIHKGFAASNLYTIDPAMGTGKFLVEVIEHVARTASVDGDVIQDRLRGLAGRLIGFEKQTCPYAVAELRIAEAMRHHQAEPPSDGMRLYVVDTLDPVDTKDLLDEFGEPIRRKLGTAYEPIERSRREANRITTEQPVEVVIANPPHKTRAKGLGGWIEASYPTTPGTPPLDAFRTPGEGRYQHKLSNLYIYFWRWATWKVFDAHPDAPTGVVALITPSSYLSGRGFSGMREYLRRTVDEGWIIDLSPEDLQSPVPTRIFPEVAQPLCIGIFVRRGLGDPSTPAQVHYLSIEGRQEDKFRRLGSITLNDTEWRPCAAEWQAPLKPAATAEWISSPRIVDLLPWSVLGITPNRTWVHAPDPETLRLRWRRLIKAPPADKRRLLKETIDRDIDRSVPPILGGPESLPPLRGETRPCSDPVRLGIRSFDRQWIIPDNRIIDRPRPELWRCYSRHQIYLTEPQTEAVTAGPAITFTADLPYAHHYRGRAGGRAIPLYRDGAGVEPNVTPSLLTFVSQRLGIQVHAEDLFAYIAGLAAHPGFTARFRKELDGTDVRVPVTADAQLFIDVSTIGRRVLWLHTYGQRYSDPSAGRPPGPPQLPDGRRPRVTKRIPTDAGVAPDRISYDALNETLHVGMGGVHPVPESVWNYKVSHMPVVRKWFRSRTGKPTGQYPTKLDYIHPRGWTIETVDELLQLLHVLDLLVELEPRQASLLQRVCAGPLVTQEELFQAGVLPVPASARQPTPDPRGQTPLF